MPGGLRRLQGQNEFPLAGDLQGIDPAFMLNTNPVVVTEQLAAGESRGRVVLPVPGVTLPGRATGGLRGGQGMGTGLVIGNENYYHLLTVRQAGGTEVGQFVMPASRT